MTLDHVTLMPSDFGASLTFYDAALGALGLVRVAELVDEEEDGAALEAVGWGTVDGPASLWLVVGDAVTTGLHVRLRADSHAQVEAFHAAGTGTGGRSRSRPRRWAIYRRGEFGAMLADPDGNIVEAVAAE